MHAAYTAALVVPFPEPSSAALPALGSLDLPALDSLVLPALDLLSLPCPRSARDNCVDTHTHGHVAKNGWQLERKA